MAKYSMTEEELCAAIDQEISQALGEDSDKLSRQRANAMENYLGEPYGNEKPNASQVVTREVMDTIEWIKPELMKLFASGSETVRFEPQNASDVDAAQQATDYINYLFHRKNEGFKVLYEWITDGLLQKNGVVKVWWDNEATKVREEYAGLTDLELQMLLAPDEVELQEQQSEDGEPGPDGQPTQTHTVAIIRTGAESGLKVVVVPPEEFLISRKAKDIKSSPFCAHRTQMTISDLNAMGYDTDDLPGGDEHTEYDEVRLARYKYDDTDDETNRSDPADDTMRQVWVTEAYIRADMDDDGIAELRKVCKVGSKVLANEEVDAMPFASWTPIILPHKFIGLSEADLVTDLQKIQSQLFRNMLDNQYLTNNGRYAAVDNMVNLDDLMSSRPGGVVRIKMAGAVTRLDTPQLGTTAFQMLDYVDRLRERRTGVSERTQGMDPNQLNANTAASAVNQVMTAAQQRVELIARVFGETGLTDLFLLMYKEVLQNQSSKDIFRLRDAYIEVDPSEWRERKDTSVVVGLGNGSKEQEMMQLNMIFQNQQQLIQNPAAQGLVLPQNIYNTAEDQVKVFNKAAAGRYFTDPTSPEAQQAAQAAAQQQQAMQQQQDAIQQQQMQMEQMKIQIDQMEAATNKAYKEGETALGQEAQALNEQKHVDDVALQTAELQAEVALESEQGRGVSLGR